MERGESLRDEIERRTAAGGRFKLSEAVAAIVPLITSLHDKHQGGDKLYVNPSSVKYAANGCTIDDEAAKTMPLLPKDRACMAPEERKGGPGDARASVFACGAILYEMITGEAIGPGMRRPSELVKGLPEVVEVLLSKALVGDPGHRPNDLGALAQALHHAAPTASIPPPPADEGALDHGADFDVDVSISMIPPANVQAARAVVEAEIAKAKAKVASERPAAAAVASSAPVAVSAPAATSTPTRDSAPMSGPISGGGGESTRRLAELKQRLESDPRPRYTVIKDGMDHGPFTAVELLHQLATASFVGEHRLLDTISKDERPIKEWPEFAPFAQQARISVEAKKERASLEASVEQEAERTQMKGFIIAAVAVLGLAAAGGLYMRFGKKATEEAGIKGEKAHNVDFEGGVKKGEKKGGGQWAGGPGSPGESGAGHPQIAGGQSCEAARAAYIEDYSQKGVPPDLGAGAYANVLNNGSYLNACGVPPSMSVNICAAVQNGMAVGVTVSTNPPNGGIARCISGAVRSMSFPPHPRLDVTNTSFAAQ